MNNPLEKRESRADFSYVPKVRDLKEAMYVSDDLDLMDRIIANYEHEEGKPTRKTAKKL